MNRATTTLGRRAFVLSGSVAALAPASPLLAHADRAMLTITEPSGRVRELRDEDIAALPGRSLPRKPAGPRACRHFAAPS